MKKIDYTKNYIFYNNCKEKKIRDEVYIKAENLPILGNKDAKMDALLFHYSTEDDIKEFKIKPGRCCWTSMFSDQFSIVSNTTQCIDHNQFRAVYIIRLGINNNDSGFLINPIIENCNYARSGKEYELNKSIPSNLFAKILINPDQENKAYNLP
ncbi:hypothetical protein [Vibrio splendidus]|uniref:hypothetical protein n=1 Tax=Vibrio splendidus TaxID=29497 RepID=UPI000C84EE80|nr:hypothetical protein [Vibrio splendidus]PMK44628.1 hypothetical protein BCU01_10000 [Vibrio splendidus]